MFLQDVAQDESRSKSPMIFLSFRYLSPYDHLTYILRLCVTHYRRRILLISGNLPPSVVAAMHALASAYPIENFDDLIALIRTGGKDAISELLYFTGSLPH